MSQYEGIPSQKLPSNWQPYYVFYQNSFTKSEYLVGFSSLENAEAFKSSLLNKKDLIKAEVFHDYPTDILKRGLR